MKTGVILEIENGKAQLMLTGGEFITVKAKPGWQKGDVVSVPAPSQSTFSWKTFSAAAACLLLLLSVSIGSYGYKVWNDPSTLISLDVNPSIELQVNRFDRVISVKAYNREAKQLLKDSRIEGQTLDQAISKLFRSGLESYLKQSPYIAYSVQSSDAKKESTLSASLKSLTEQLTGQYDATQKTSIDVYAVDATVVSTAHSHHVTAGKYMAIRQLQQVNPTVQIEEYAHCGIGEINLEIEHCSGQHNGNGNGSGNGCRDNDDSQNAYVDPDSGDWNGGTMQEPDAEPQCGRNRHGHHGAGH